MYSRRVGSAQRRTVIFCWLTATTYIWINMRQNQINKRTAGKNNPVKDQTAGSFSPPPAALSCLIFLQFIPIFLSSHLSFFILTYFTCLLCNYTFTLNIHFWFPSFFLSILPHFLSPFWFHGHIFNLALPPFPVQHSLPLPSLSAAFLPSAERNGD